MRSVIYLTHELLEDLHEAFLEKCDRLSPEDLKCDWNDLYEYIIRGCLYASRMLLKNVANDDDETISQYIYSELYAHLLPKSDGGVADIKRTLMKETDFGYYRGIARELSEMPEVLDVFHHIHQVMPGSDHELSHLVIDEQRIKVVLGKKFGRNMSNMKIGTHEWYPEIVTVADANRRGR